MRLALFTFLVVTGCGRQQSSSHSDLAAAQRDRDRKELLREFAEAERQAAKTEPPRPVIELPAVHGWMQSSPKALNADDHGFN